MSSSPRNRLPAIVEFAANVSIVVVCALLVVTLYRQATVRPVPLGDAAQFIKPGDRIQIDGVDWSASSQTLVLALNRSCKFCTASAPFYRRLSKARGSSRFSLVAAMPHLPAESGIYLKEMGFTVDTIVQIDLGKTKILATPTILLVDSSGVVSEVWRGQLDAENENAVMTRLKVMEST